MPHLLATFPVELRLYISRYLTAQELQTVSSSCKLLYQLFANQSVWKNAYKSLLKGYPDNNFVVTQLVRESKRLDCLIFDRPLTLKWLEDWRTSWKQRTIFVLHIIKIQSELVSIARQRTHMLFDQPKDTPLFDTKFITDMESHLGAEFPIDFVIFLQNFAHQVTFFTERHNYNSDDHMVYQMPMLASGSEFKSFRAWEHANHKPPFTILDKRDLLFSKIQLPLPDSSRRYLDKTVIACFSQVEYGLYYDIDHELRIDGDDLEFEDYHLGLILSTDQSLQNEVPSTIDSEEPHDTAKSIKHSIGKVVFKGRCSPYFSQLKIISESFTDYLVQWGSIAIVRRDSSWCDRNGCIDFVKTLLKHPTCLLSILLPQYTGWNTGNYAPIYFSMGTHTSMSKPPFLSMLLSPSSRYWDESWPTPPSAMMGGGLQKYWEPY